VKSSACRITRAAAGAGSPLQTQRWYGNANGADGAASTGSGAATVKHGWTLNGSAAAWVDAGVDIVAATPPTQTVAHGLGQAPKALILWTSGNTGTTYVGDFNLSIGFSDGTASGTTATASQDARSAALSGRLMADKVITIIDGSQTVLAEADVASWDNTNFTLTWTTNDDVEQTKPEPDLVKAALEKVDGAEAVMVGDTKWDVEAAAKAGIPTICVMTGGWSRQELLDAGALQVYESVEELREKLDETPLV
jgi:hypothetical protein